ncbi:hypothetical protein T484DRAFT_3638153 [Baffinella frigidus]|nr:hypothetical protein T484DRAFT_3638153 [Cryptophyta sp. CCMP2293]
MSYLPKALISKFNELANFSREKISIVPSSGQTLVTAGQTVILDLPYSSMLALDSLEMHFDFASTAGDDDTVINEVLYAPRNAASFIQGLEIRFNNAVVQNITDYNFLHNKLSDYTSQEDSIKRRNVAGENADISTKFTTDANGYVTGRTRGFAHAAAGVAKADRVDAKRMVVRSLLGFLSSNSVSVIDTGVVGNIQLRFFLAAPSVLIKSDGVQSAAASSAPGGQAANKTYNLSNIEFKITRMTFPSQYYESAAAKLSSGIPTVMYFDDYQSFSGAMVSNTKTQQMRMTVSVNSIKYLMGTFVLANREVIGPCIVTDPRHDETLHSKFVAAKPQLLYNSSYFYSTGLGLTGSSWVIGSQRLPQNPSTNLDCFTNMGDVFNINQDSSLGVSPFISSLEGFTDGNFCDMLPLGYFNESEKIVCGLNTKNLPVAIIWETKSGNATDQDCYPVVYVCTDKKITIHATQQIEID